jgi:uncharacterized protein (DUF1499 family)
VKTLLVVVLLLAIAGLVLLAIGPEKLWHRLGRIAPVELSGWAGRDTPNWALACPDDANGKSFCQQAERTHDAPVVKAGKNAVYEWFVTYAEGGDGTGLTILSRDAERGKLRFEALSSVLKFPDIIDLEIVSLEDGRVSIALLSQSLLGKGDFGVNSQRLDAWLKDFARAFPE